jgi:two-component system KDP operon response regulator KdpE
MMASCGLLGDHLSKANYTVITATNGKQGLQLAAQEKPGLVVLDVMMPGMDGWEVCQALRKFSDVPIIMLTAKDQEFDKLRGFRLGVDDYVTKPFSFAEIVARVGAIIARSRSSAQPSHKVISGELTIDFDRHSIESAGHVIELTRRYRLLETLARNANRTIPTERVLVEVWGIEYAGEVEHVKHYVWALRKKIEVDPGNPKHIITDRNFGYRFE